MNKTITEKLLKKLAHGLPIKTACALLRIDYSIFYKEYTNNKEFALDVDQASALALEQIISSLFSDASSSGKIALEYLKKRDAENWSDHEKRELIRNQEREYLLQLLRDSLPNNTFIQILQILEENFD